MAVNISQENRHEATKESYYPNFSLFVAKLKSGIWAFGIPSWLFGLTDRGVAALGDGYLSAVELFQLFAASVLFMSWICLKPEETYATANLLPYQLEGHPYREEVGQCGTPARRVNLPGQHFISQCYTLPYPYICQIYHLLNLKHLEHVHHFSLSNLRVINVSELQPTQIGGTIKFQTVLDSPFNPLRIWRQPVVEVELTLHTPQTVELRIPAYQGKQIIVLFNVLPINDNEHKFFIDIYSDLQWPRPVLQLLFHVAACLTLFEDLPYLQRLAERNIQRLVRLNRVSEHRTMWLFQRFVDLYGAEAVATSATSERPMLQPQVDEQRC